MQCEQSFKDKGNVTVDVDIYLVSQRKFCMKT